MAACLTQHQCLDPGLTYEAPDCITRLSCEGGRPAPAEGHEPREPPAHADWLDDPPRAPAAGAHWLEDPPSPLAAAGAVESTKGAPRSSSAVPRPWTKAGPGLYAPPPPAIHALPEPSPYAPPGMDPEDIFAILVVVLVLLVLGWGLLSLLLQSSRGYTPHSE